jgi:hypothetical protein
MVVKGIVSMTLPEYLLLVSKAAKWDRIQAAVKAESETA